MTYPAVVELIAQLHDAAQDPTDFIEGMTLADFMADKRTNQAVVMNFIIIGEIAARIMDRHPDFARTHHQIPWQGMRGMRNRIAHVYFEIHCQRRSDTAAVCRSNSAARTQARRPPISGAFLLFDPYI